MRNVNVPLRLSSDCAVMLCLCCNDVNLHDCCSLWLCMTTGSLDRKYLETEKKKKDTFAALCSSLCMDRASRRGGGACLTRFMLKKVCVGVCSTRTCSACVCVWNFIVMMEVDSLV